MPEQTTIQPSQRFWFLGRIVDGKAGKMYWLGDLSSEFDENKKPRNVARWTADTREAYRFTIGAIPLPKVQDWAFFWEEGGQQ